MTSATRRQEALITLQNDLASDHGQCHDLSEELRSSSTKNVEVTLAALELALTKIFKLVVYKQAHRDSLDQTIIQQPASLFAQVISTFSDAAEKGKNTFDSMGRIHTKVRKSSQALTETKNPGNEERSECRSGFK